MKLHERTPELYVPDLAEIDFPALRRGRLANLQKAMSDYEIAACLFFGQGDIRYATGTAIASAWSESAFKRCCVVPASGQPILFELPGYMHMSSRIVDDVRPMPGGGASRWVNDIRDAFRDLGVSEHSRIAVDKLDVERFLALQAAGIAFVDSTPLAIEAQEVKTPEEISLFAINGSIADAMLYEVECAIHPGVRESDLTSILSATLIRLQGEGLFTRYIVSGRDTNPWYRESRNKLLMPSDLVTIDTDAHGVEGYVMDVTRTFLCGQQSSQEQRDAYRAAYDAVQALRETVKVGMSFEDVARSVPPLPERYRERRFSMMAHQVGLEERGRSIPYVEDVQLGHRSFGEVQVKPGMILCLEGYAGEVDGLCGVKLEDQVVVTPDGCKLLSTYPYDLQLLGA